MSDVSVASFRTYLKDGCSGCEFDEAEGGLLNHCAACQLLITSLAYGIFVLERYQIVAPTSPAVQPDAGLATPQYPDRIGGWAKGNYECRCSNCHRSFVGDKRSIHCRECATSFVADRATLPATAPLLAGFFKCRFCGAEAPEGKHVCGDRYTDQTTEGQK